MRKPLIQQLKLTQFEGKFKGISFNPTEINTGKQQTFLKMYERKNILETSFSPTSLVFPQLFSPFLVFINSNNNILQKSIISVRCLLKQIKFLIKGMNQMFFLEFRIAGLGYKIFKLKKRSLDLKILCLKLGYSHLIQYIFPRNIHLLIGRRHLFFIY